MKTLLLLCLLAASAFAAAPVVTIANSGNAYVDGVNVGAPADAIANNPALASPIQIALSAFIAKVNADQAAATKAAQDSAAAQVAAAESAKAQAIADHAAAKAAEIDALKAKVAELQAEVAALKAQ